jgi:folylpolyglutamate synthase/dihydropteroate synthase
LRIHFFGSHNPDGLRKLVQKLKRDRYNFTSKKLTWIFSFSKRSVDDLRTMFLMIKELEDCGEVVIPVLFEHTKAADTVVLKELSATILGKEIIDDWKTFFQELPKKKNTTADVVVTGSYYFVGQVQSFIQGLSRSS